MKCFSKFKMIDRYDIGTICVSIAWYKNILVLQQCSAKTSQRKFFLLHLHSLFSLLLYSTIEGYSTCLLNGITLFCMILDCIKDFLLPYSSDFGRRKAMKKLCLENHSCYHPINSIKYICYINLIDGSIVIRLILFDFSICTI